jgi:hypothetical protein
MLAKGFDRLGDSTNFLPSDQFDQLLAWLVFERSIERVLDTQTRINLFRVVEWLGQSMFANPQDSSNWISLLAERMHQAAADRMARAVQRLWQARMEQFRTVQNLFDLAVCADFGWYVKAKLQEEPALLHGSIQKVGGTKVETLPLLLVASMHQCFTVQAALLEAGADPNQRSDPQGSSWEVFLRTSAREIDLHQNSIVIQLFGQYLDCAANPSMMSRRYDVSKQKLLDCTLADQIRSYLDNSKLRECDRSTLLRSLDKVEDAPRPSLKEDKAARKVRKLLERLLPTV